MNIAVSCYDTDRALNECECRDPLKFYAIEALLTKSSKPATPRPPPTHYVRAIVKERIFDTILGEEVKFVHQRAMQSVSVGRRAQLQATPRRLMIFCEGHHGNENTVLLERAGLRSTIKTRLIHVAFVLVRFLSGSFMETGVSVVERNRIKKIGIILKGTPKLVVVYERDRRFRRRSMPVRGIYRNSDLKIITAELSKKHDVLGELQSLQIEKLLSIVQETVRGSSVKDAIAFATKKYSLDPEEDLNVLDDKALEVKKELMSSSFQKNSVKPGDPNFKYDVEVDFNTFETSAGWDSDSDEVVDF
ncbi:uncharacterized protein LOC114828248 [Galendromus occidentalis]|uniref:Centrosomal protein of 19 kDa n=1 Tax=Galendromus occidentalis TaxID=34638 RepID=A0AAJ7SET3_9ACAR|nr:uncharacterized protein LOC114828248 [Galendromus occidentalis]